MQEKIEAYEKKIEEYTQKYMTKHKVTKEEAEKTLMIKLYREHVYKTRGGE